MSVNFSMITLVAILASCATYLLLSKSLSRIIFGFLLFSNALNLLIITISGKPGKPPIFSPTNNNKDEIADPLAQAMVLTGIVIPMGLVAFCLALTYRYFTITNDDKVTDDQNTTIDNDIENNESDLIVTESKK